VSQPLLGPYVLEDPVARGGGGVVWRAVNGRTGVPVAIKIIHPNPGQDPRAFRKAFQREVRGMASLDHRGVVRVFDMGTLERRVALDIEPGGQWFAMEWASGGSLRHWSPSDWNAAKQAVFAILESLAYVHARGLLHRDLKPGNVIRCGPEDARPGYKLADFGLVRAYASADAEERAIGTPQYVAPEQVRDDRAEQGPWTDLYALGCLVWAMLAGKPPFYRENPFEALNAHVYDRPPRFAPTIAIPKGVEGWIRKLLSKKPTDRFLFAADAACALEALDRGETTSSRTIPIDWRSSRGRDERGTVPEPSLLPLRELPLVGRDAVLDDIWAHFRDAESRRHCTGIALVGPAGTGKSRLVRWLSERAHTLGVGFSLDGVGEGPAAMWSRFLGGTGPGLGDRIATRLPTLSRDWKRRMQSWLQGRQEQNWRGLTLSALEALSSSRPVVVTLAGSELDPWLTSAVTKLEAPVLLAISDIEEVPEGFVRVDLGPLSEDAHRAAIGALVQLREPLVERLVLRTDGNPGLTRLVVMHWAQIGLLRATDHGVYAMESDGELPMPDHLEAAARRQTDVVLAPFSLDYRLAAEIAAALGHHVNRAEWLAGCAVAGVAEGVEVEDVLLAAGLAYQPRDDQRWSWSHALSRAAILASAEETGRLRDAHRYCAAAIDDIDENLGRRGRHLYSAGDFEAAVAPLSGGFKHSFWHGKTTERQLHLELARQAAEAASLPSSDERWGTIRLDEAGLFPSTDVEIMDRVFAELLSDADRHDWGLTRQMTAIRYATWQWSTGRLTQATPLLDAVIAQARFPQAVRRALSLRAWMHFHVGELGAVHSIAARMLTDIEHPTEIGLGYLLHGVAHYNGGDLNAAERAFEESARILEEAGIQRALVQSCNGLGDVRRKQGRFVEARAMYTKSLEMTRFGSRYQVHSCRLNLGLLGVVSGDTADGRAQLLKCQSLVPYREFEVATCDALLAHCDALEGAWPAASRRLKSGGRVLLQHRIFEVDCVQSVQAVADLARDAGKADLERAALELAAEMWAGCDRPELAKSALDRMHKSPGE